MKARWVAVGFVLLFSFFFMFSIIKFATEVSGNGKEKTAARHVEYDEPPVLRVSASGARRVNDNRSYDASLRYPYIAAVITRKSPNDANGWTFSCFGCVVQNTWVLTAAHCKKPDHSHRVLLFFHYIRNSTKTFPVLEWKVHDGFEPNSTIPWNDIALARVGENLEPTSPALPYALTTYSRIPQIQASVWKTIFTMDRRTFLTNDLELYDAEITDPTRCYEHYGFTLDDTLLCVDMSRHADCFVTEFGPIFSSTQRVVGLLRMSPRNCDNKIAIFTNVSWYMPWIFKEMGVGVGEDRRVLL